MTVSVCCPACVRLCSQFIQVICQEDFVHEAPSCTQSPGFIWMLISAVWRFFCEVTLFEWTDADRHWTRVEGWAEAGNWEQSSSVVDLFLPTITALCLWFITEYILITYHIYQSFITIIYLIINIQILKSCLHEIRDASFMSDRKIIAPIMSNFILWSIDR